ncbi:hypothetical protein EDB19DRAFT_1838324 [Suillus lakei]|nr:hypothetical protein EDB19DRAFT_1838324 [Suillus lakei]
MNDSCSNVRCPHGKPVQMLRHPCFTMEQFIEAIHLVQSGHGRDDTESSAAAADNSLDNTSSNYGGDEAESSASATETLINLDPAHYFNWFVATSHFGVGIFSEIYTARKLRAPGTSVHYFTTFDEAKQHFDLALAMWCVISGEYLVNIWGISGEYPAGREQRHPQQNPSIWMLYCPSYACPEVWLILHQTIHNKTMEQAKSRTRWRMRRHFNDCYAYLLHKQDIVALFRTLDQLSTELGYKSGVPEARTLQSRVIAVLQRVSDEGWSVGWLPSYMMRCNNLSQELVDLMGRRLAVEKEVILIIDEGGVEAYDEAMLSDSLSWHWISQKRRALKHYQRDFYAHSAAASKAVKNDTNDAPQHTRDLQQCKHSSFEAGRSGRLNVSSTYYTVPNSPGKRRRGDSEVPLETTEFDFTTLERLSR